jgi:hypothetical protein
LLNLIDIREVQSVVSIFKFFFGDDENIYRTIFPSQKIDIILKLQLYKYFNFFIKDFLSSKSLNCENEYKDILKENLFKYLIDKNNEGLNEVYSNFKEKNFINYKDLTARCIDEDKYFSSLMESNKFSESYIFNESNNLNKKADDILKKNVDLINKEIK